jgi:hypothetical protein
VDEAREKKSSSVATAPLRWKHLGT